jgi:hypothetical protein
VGILQAVQNQRLVSGHFLEIIERLPHVFVWGWSQKIHVEIPFLRLCESFVKSAQVWKGFLVYSWAGTGQCS